MGFATTNRIAIAVLVLGAVFRKAANWAAPITAPASLTPILASIALCIGWGALSAVMSPYGDAASPVYLISWSLAWFAAALAGILCIGMTPTQKDRLLSVMIIGAAMITLGTAGYVIALIGPAGFADPFLVRKLFISFGPGMNRHMNGLFMLNCVTVAVLLGIVRRSLPLYATAGASVAAFLALILLSGSRQTLVATACLLPTLWFMARNPASGRRLGSAFASTARTTLLVLISVAAIWALSTQLGFDVGFWLQTRFVDRTMDQYGSSDERVVILYEGLSVIAHNPWFGVGPGAFVELKGLQPHNGHIRVASEMGIPALFFLWSGFALVIARALRMRARMRKSQFADLYTVSVSAAIVLFFVSNQFNDLLNDYGFWLFIVFIVICMTNARRQRRIEHRALAEVVEPQSATNTLT